MTEMTQKELRRICKDTDGYSTPYLNDKLYLHYKGFRKMENLEEYYGVKVLYLEGNGFTKIEGLSKCTELRCLYIHENLLERIEGLEGLEGMDTINVNNNYITKIENLECCPKLNTVQMQNNRLQKLDDLKGFLKAPSLSVIDVQSNLIDDERVLEEVFMKMPNLKVLYLKGNPVVEKFQPYRKTIVSKIKTLTYLDDRPVFADERRLADAWARGGNDAEQAERDLIKQEGLDKQKRNHEAFSQMVRDAKAEKAALDANKGVQEVKVTEQKLSTLSVSEQQAEGDDDNSAVPDLEHVTVADLPEAHAVPQAVDDVHAQKKEPTVTSVKPSVSVHNTALDDKVRKFLTDSEKATVPSSAFSFTPVPRKMKIEMVEDDDVKEDDMLRGSKIQSPVAASITKKKVEVLGADGLPETGGLDELD